MACAEFFSFTRSIPPQRPLPPLPHESGIDETCGTIESPRVLKKQSSARVSASDIRSMITPFQLFERAQGRREQRKLRRVAASPKNQATTTQPKVTSPGDPHASKAHPPHYTVDEIYKYLNSPKKLTRKSSDQSVPNGWYQPGAGTPLMAPAGSRQSMQESETPYSESRGELQRQFAISQRLQRKRLSGTPDPAEVGAYLGGLERLHDKDGWVDGFRIEVEKPLRRVYAQRLQRGSWGGPMTPEKPKKVRFASVVECFEF